jgi:Family of unknown function (DUF5662)
MSNYDSRIDTYPHIARVNELLGVCATKLIERGNAHDRSKLESPEKEAFDTLPAKLKDFKYGSDEYKAALKELGPALDHHYAQNTHHPEHFKDGVNGMSLFDVIEMVMDWKAGSERMKDGGNIARSIEINTERFGINPQLAAIMRNTVAEMGWK